LMVTLAVCLGGMLQALGTPQMGDCLVHDGVEHSVYGFSLPADARNRFAEWRTQSLHVVTSSCNWRGYVCRMDVRRERLYLTDLDVTRIDSPWPFNGPSVRSIFGMWVPPLGVRADWFSGELCEPMGRPIRSYTTLTRYERVFAFTNGTLLRVEKRENNLVRGLVARVLEARATNSLAYPEIKNISGEEDEVRESARVEWFWSGGLSDIRNGVGRFFSGWVLGNPGVNALVAMWLFCFGALPLADRARDRVRRSVIGCISLGSALLVVMPVLGFWSWIASLWAVAWACVAAGIGVLVRKRARVALHLRQRFPCVVAGLVCGLHAVLFEVRRGCFYHNGFRPEEDTGSFVVAAIVTVCLGLGFRWAWTMAAVFSMWAIPTSFSENFVHPAYDPPALYMLVAVLAPLSLAMSFRPCGIGWRDLLFLLLAPAVLLLASMIPQTYGMVPNIGEPALMAFACGFICLVAWLLRVLWRRIRMEKRPEEHDSAMDAVVGRGEP
jgi:hypothetical protein